MVLKLGIMKLLFLLRIQLIWKEMLLMNGINQFCQFRSQAYKKISLLMELLTKLFFIGSLFRRDSQGGDIQNIMLLGTFGMQKALAKIAFKWIPNI
jgi:hypothetical protein